LFEWGHNRDVPPRRLVREDVDFLALLSAANRRRVLQGSTHSVLPAGAIAYSPGSPEIAFVIEEGLLRVYWSVPDGRQATVAFLHKDEMGGAAFGARHPMWFYVQIVSESTLSFMNLKTFRDLATIEVEVMAAITAQQENRIRNAFRLIAVRSLGTVRERLAYDLLERSCQSQLAVGRLEVRTTQTELADSIGSSREVVSRAVSGFRNAGIVETSPGVIQIVDPLRLSRIVRDFVL
jgi:CRP-like cAMP-binding protein